jgi:hypothetical protein
LAAVYNIKKPIIILNEAEGICKPKKSRAAHSQEEKEGEVKEETKRFVLTCQETEESILLFPSFISRVAK